MRNVGHHLGGCALGRCQGKYSLIMIQGRIVEPLHRSALFTQSGGQTLAFNGADGPVLSARDQKYRR